MEPIKQEIINNIFENGDKLITGPILQTVLIDMIDDVNVKDQEILSKTGSWDDAATQIPNLATKEEVTNLSESVARDLENVDVDLTGYATEQWVQNQGYLKEHQDISGLATKTELTQAENNLQGNITSLSESVARDIANVSVPEGVATEAWVQSQDYASKTYVNEAVSSSSVDLTGYATETWVESQGYLKEHQDISGLATKVELTEAKNNLQGNITSLSESVARDLANVDVDLTGYATETWVQSQGYLKEHQDISNLATKGELNSVSESIQTDISNLATKTELNDTKNNLQGNLTSLSESVARDLTGYATETWVQSQGYLKEHQDISNLATKVELTSVSESVQTDITNLSESVANSAVWKKGGGQDSIVQVLTGANEPYAPSSEAAGAVAIGSSTLASGEYSHAEGDGTNASGQASHTEGSSTFAEGSYSHAEGRATWTSGDYSHAEGLGTITTNLGEHAQGILNESSENQIFSVGAGDGDPTNPPTATRRNVISVLAVDNNGSRTGSFFVQNVGGYDGTNPEPGTNDLATVINNLPSGGSSETLWKKGEGTDSIVQIKSGLEGTVFAPKATGAGAIATGRSTNASGTNSHAEGEFTIASNQYEHAQGRYNHTSSDQIFSIGVGIDNTDRRNAVSVLEVRNNNSYTGSFFVQNIGGYDGTNPLPGTNDLATVINGMSSGGGSSETLWKKGKGQDSIVQVITEDRYNPRASGLGAVAIGYYSHAEGNYSHAEGEGSHAEGTYSHAEGYSVNTGGQYSHAEGYLTTTAGKASHAEGYNTSASNDYEHAQGINNYSSANQIFSVGAGDSIKDPNTQVVTETRRNAISVLAVPNSDTQVVTASFFVQNIGGYDGTNPTPGTNDLATVINEMAIEGGIGTSSETWTFTLEDGSTVTKNIVMR